MHYGENRAAPIPERVYARKNMWMDLAKDAHVEKTDSVREISTHAGMTVRKCANSYAGFGVWHLAISSRILLRYASSASI